MGTSSRISLGESLLRKPKKPLSQKMSLKELAQKHGLSYSCLYQRLQAGIPLEKINYQSRLTPEFKARILEEMKTRTHRELEKQYNISRDTLTKIRKELK